MLTKNRDLQNCRQSDGPFFEHLMDGSEILLKTYFFFAKTNSTADGWQKSKKVQKPLFLLRQVHQKGTPKSEPQLFPENGKGSIAKVGFLERQMGVA